MNTDLKQIASDQLSGVMKRTLLTKDVTVTYTRVHVDSDNKV